MPEQLGTRAEPLANAGGLNNVVLLTLCLALCLWGMLTPNAVLTVASVLTYFVIAKLLWRPGEPPALLFAVSYQWLQVTAKVFHADYRGVPLVRLAYSSPIDRAVLMSLGALFLLALGMRLGVRQFRVALAMPRFEARIISINHLAIAYVVAAVVATLATSLVSSLPSLGQLLFAIAALRWAAYYMLAYVIITRGSHKWYLVIATLIEFVIGIGYFSEFKTVIFVAVLAILSLDVRLRGRSAALASAAGVFLIIVALGWTSIKQDYRTHLSGGLREQVSVVSPKERVTTFVSMMTSLRPHDFVASIDELADRVAYVDYFGSVLERVPSILPFENGSLLWSAIEHILSPRFLFPGKAALLSDSDMTMHYTGRTLAGNEEGTSISMGYVTESYIDFGPVLMYLPILLIGVAWGSMYRFLIRNGRLVIIGYAFATALLINANQFEMTGIKLLGGMVAKFLVLAIVLRVGSSAMTSWLVNGEAAAARQAKPKGSLLPIA